MSEAIIEVTLSVSLSKSTNNGYGTIEDAMKWLTCDLLGLDGQTQEAVYRVVKRGEGIRVRLTASQMCRFFFERRRKRFYSRVQWADEKIVTPSGMPLVIDITGKVCCHAG